MVLLLSSSAPLKAQSIYGTITGTVYDPSGAVVANATVILKNVASGDIRRGATNSDGYYSFSSVPTGSYTITVEAAGFQKTVTGGVEVTGAASLSFPIKLTIGSAAIEVKVEGIADQIIPTDSGEKSTVLQEKQLQDFTIVSANAAEFIKILPGFAPINKGNGLASGTDYTGEIIGINGNGDGGSQSPLNGAFAANGFGTSNGNGTNNVDITADGAHVSDPGCNCATPVNPNPDMISEFKVLTSNFSAENSKGPIVISSVTKSGGHDFHGSAYLNARNYGLNANRWLNNKNNVPIPQNKFYYPGGSIGGPVLFPHSDFNHNRDKMFFFTGFEYFYQVLDTGLLTATVPTGAMRGGDFSSIVGNLNSCLTVSPVPSTLDNNNNFICGTAASPRSFMGGLVTTFAGEANAPIPGGVFPANLISPVGQGMLNLYPSVPAGSGFSGNYAKDIAFNQNGWQWSSRVDYNFSDNTKLYVRYNLQKETQQFPIGLWWRNPPQVPYPTPILGKNRSDSISASLLHVFNPTLSNEVVFGYTYIDFPNVFQNASKVDRTALSIPFTGIFNNGIKQIPSITGWGGEVGTLFNPSGFQEGGSAGLYATKWLPSFGDTLSKVWGTHTMKFGAYYEYVVNKQPSNNYGNGLFVQAGWAGGSSGDPYADLLAGFAGQYQESNKDVLHNEAYNQLDFFGQDSWKMTHRLTVDYGLRVSHLGPWYDRQGNGFAVWNPALYDPKASTSTGTGFDWHGKNKNVPLSGFPVRPLYYAPRVGAAYDLFGNGRTVLRGGWGLYYFHTAQSTQGLDQPLGVQTPTLNSVNIAQIQSTLSTLGPPAFNAQGVGLADDKSPHSQSYSFTVSQRLPFSSLLEVSYVGDHGYDVSNGTGVGTNVNVVPLGALLTAPFDPSNQNTSNCGPGGVGSGNKPCPSEYAFAGLYPTYQAINIATHNITSNYNAMQVVWVRSKGRYDLSFNYTWSKSLGIVGLDQLNLNQDYGAQPFDRRHLFNAAYSIELPNPVHDNKVLAGVVNGWQVSGINTVQSGVNLTQSSNNTNFNTTGNITKSITQNLGIDPVTGQQMSATWFLTANNAFNSSLTSYSINGTDFVPLAPTLTCNPRTNLGPNQYVNGNCFTLSQTPGQNGSTVLPEFFGPWFWTWDLSLFKNFTIKERQKLQFRFSAYNWLNHPEWSFTSSGNEADALYLHFSPDTSVPCVPTGGSVANDTKACYVGPVQANKNFGTPNVKFGNRIIQFALKYTF